MCQIVNIFMNIFSIFQPEGKKNQNFRGVTGVFRSGNPPVILLILQQRMQIPVLPPLFLPQNTRYPGIAAYPYLRESVSLR